MLTPSFKGSQEVSTRRKHPILLGVATSLHPPSRSSTLPGRRADAGFHPSLHVLTPAKKYILDLTDTTDKDKGSGKHYQINKEEIKYINMS
jgi:hypothetical protein